MDFQLTSGVLQRLLGAAAGDDDLWTSSPTLQILSLKKIPNPREGQANSSPDRYRLIVSDGEKFTQAMLATQLSHMVNDNELTRHCIVRAEKLTCNTVQNKKCVVGSRGRVNHMPNDLLRLLILLNLVVLGNAEKIGDPSGLDMPGQVPEGVQVQSNGGSAAGSPSTTSAPTTIASTPSATAQPKTNGYHKANPVNGPTIFPIEGLSPYQNKWTIKARVTQKSDIRTWSNAKGEGKLFNVTLMDESGEIRATGFNQVVDDLYEKFEEGKVYYVSKARVNLAKKKFSNLANEYELSLERHTEVEEVSAFHTGRLWSLT